MPKVRKIGRVTFRDLTNEEALREYGTSFVFVGQATQPADRRELLRQADTALGRAQVDRFPARAQAVVRGRRS
jgi:hypothetical protein